MATAHTTILMAPYTVESGLMASIMAGAGLPSQMELTTMANGGIIRYTEVVYTLTIWAANGRENFAMGFSRVGSR